MPVHHTCAYLPNQGFESGRSDMSGWYEIRLDGHLDSRWTAWFDVVSLTHESNGTTVIHAQVADQSSLHGLLQKVRDIGIPLVSVAQVEPDLSPTIQQTTHPTTHATTHKGD
jgi:hypothetical protein